MLRSRVLLARAGALRAPLARGPPATQLPRQIPAVPQWSRSFSLTSTTMKPDDGHNNRHNNKQKPTKAIKPSSKANARSSRLLRSQLAPGSSTATANIKRQQAAEDAEAAESPLASGPQIAESVSLDHYETANNVRDMHSSSKLQQTMAFATASAYDINALVNSGRLPPDWQMLEDGQVIYLPSWPVHQNAGSSSHATYTQRRSTSGEVFILRSGAYVTWGLNADQAKRFRSLILAPRHAPDQVAVERGAYEDIGEEEMDFIRDESETTRVVGDLVILGQPPEEPPVTHSPTPDPDPWTPLLARLSFSAGLALSARLSSQEASLSTYLASVQPLPSQLQIKGRVPLPRREVVRKMGTLLKLRQMVNLEEGSKAEELDLFWENGRMEEHYDSICLALDVESRFTSLNEQLDHAENLMGVLRALLTEESSHRMEVIIIALIAIEVTLALISHGYVVNPFSSADDSHASVSHDNRHSTSATPGTIPGVMAESPRPPLRDSVMWLFGRGPETQAQQRDV